MSAGGPLLPPGSGAGGAGAGAGLNPHLAAALAAAAATLPPERVDQVWLFPPRTAGEKESGLAVLALLPREGERADRRALCTLRYEAEPDRTAKTGKGARALPRMVRRDLLEEQGIAPADRLDRIIDGVVRRLGGDGGVEAPEVRDVGGDPDRWRELLADLDPASAAPGPGA